MHPANRTILGDSQRHLYDNFKRSYSEMLYRWGLLVNRTKVLKYLSSSSDTFRGVEFVTECIKCQKVTQAPMCRDCHKPLLYCSLCRLPVRGSANSCLFCGHGGHLLHMKQWFEVSYFACSELPLYVSHFHHKTNLFFRKTMYAQQAAVVSVLRKVRN